MKKYKTKNSAHTWEWYNAPLTTHAEISGFTTGGSVVKNLPANARELRDVGLIPESWRPPGGGHGYPLQYSCLENSVNRGVWQATVHGVTQSRTRTRLHRSMRAHWNLRVVAVKREKEEWVFLFPSLENKEDKENGEQAWTFLIWRGGDMVRGCI